MSAWRGALVDEHAASALLLDQLLIDELLVSLENGQRIETKLGRDSADRGQRVTLFEDTLEDHRHHSITQLPVDRLAVVPLRVHQSAPVTLAYQSTDGGHEAGAAESRWTRARLVASTNVQLSTKVRARAAKALVNGFEVQGHHDRLLVSSFQGASPYAIRPTCWCYI